MNDIDNKQKWNDWKNKKNEKFRANYDMWLTIDIFVTRWNVIINQKKTKIKNNINIFVCIHIKFFFFISIFIFRINKFTWWFTTHKFHHYFIVVLIFMLSHRCRLNIFCFFLLHLISHAYHLSTNFSKNWFQKMHANIRFDCVWNQIVFDTIDDCKSFFLLSIHFE